MLEGKGVVRNNCCEIVWEMPVYYNSGSLEGSEHIAAMEIAKKKTGEYWRLKLEPLWRKHQEIPKASKFKAMSQT